MRSGLKKSFAARYLANQGTSTGIAPKGILFKDISDDPSIELIPHVGISRKVVIYFTGRLKFQDFNKTLREVITSNGRSVLIKDLSTMFKDRKQDLDGASCLKFSKYLVSILKQMDRTDGDHCAIESGIPIIFRKHLDDGGVVGLINHHYPEYRDIVVNIIREFYKQWDTEEFVEEDFQSLLKRANGYNEDKNTIYGVRFTKESKDPKFYLFHMETYVDRNRSLTSLKKELLALSKPGRSTKRKIATKEE